MKTWMKVLIVTLITGIPTIPLGQMIWPSPAGDPAPTAGQLPFFIFLGIFEGVVFGLGISFLLFGWPLVRNAAAGSQKLAVASFISIAWLLISWWPHDGLHRSNGMDIQRLLFIEYGFHVTLMIAGLIMCYFFIKSLQAGVINQQIAEPASNRGPLTQAGTNTSGV